MCATLIAVRFVPLVANSPLYKLESDTGVTLQPEKVAAATRVPFDLWTALLPQCRGTSVIKPPLWLFRSCRMLKTFERGDKLAPLKHFWEWPLDQEVGGMLNLSFLPRWILIYIYIYPWLLACMYSNLHLTFEDDLCALRLIEKVASLYTLSLQIGVALGISRQRWTVRVACCSSQIHL